MATINCSGKLIDLSIPRVMGIVNCTPDSFYDGGRLKTDRDLLIQVEKMLRDGATFIDVGGYSSRPDGIDITADEELSRVLPILDLIVDRFEVTGLSCDSFRESVITQALQHGANMVNDISAGKLDSKMMERVAAAQVPYIMMHMRGTPQTMKSMTHYDDLVGEMIHYYSERVAVARSYGIHDLIIDLGFGFAKNLQQNFQLLDQLDLFTSLDVPILTGISRKSMIYKVLDSSPEMALNGTTALHMIALERGSSILRAHDVREAVETIKLYRQLHEQ
ncbi:MAG: dihydropteroate synthase [Nonlabens sp.]